MEQKIAGYAREVMNYKRPGLSASPAGLNITVQAGNKITGSFLLFSSDKEDASDIRAYLTVDDCYLTLDTVSFAERAKRIHFTYDASFLPAGLKYGGMINVVSDHGGIYVPYNVDVTEKKIMSSAGEIKNLFQFASFAKDHFAEAAKILRNPDFLMLIPEKREEDRVFVNAIARDTDSLHALDLFLVRDRKKSPVRISTEKTRFEYHLTDRTLDDKIIIKKNTWGWIRAKIKVTGDFIICDKTELTMDDFDGDTATLVFTVDPTRSRKLRQSGKIVIENANDRLVFDISLVGFSAKTSITAEKNSFENAVKTFYTLADNRMGRLALNEAVTRARSYMYTVGIDGYETVSGLTDVYLNIISGNTSSAVYDLAKIKKTPENEKIFFYLNFLASSDAAEKKREAAGMRELAGKTGDEFAFFLYTLMDERYINDKSKRLGAFSRLYDEGMRSPALYLEAFLIYKDRPELLNRLGRFEIAVFTFAARHGYLTDEELSDRYVFLAGDIRKYEPLLLLTLEKIYENKPDDECLAVICSQILLSQSFTRSSHSYISEGVKRGLRLSGIYEVYIETLTDKNERIDKSAFEYFKFGNPLNNDRKAAIYAFLVKHRNEREYSDYFATYKDEITRFAEDMVDSGTLSDDISVIVRTALSDKNYESKFGESLVNVMFKAKISSDRFKDAEVDTFYKEYEEPSVTRMTIDGAYTDIFGSASISFLKDGDGLLYPVSDYGKAEKQFTAVPYLETCYEAGCRDVKLLTEIYSQNEKYHRTVGDISEICEILSHADCLTEDCRRAALVKLIEYYYGNYDGAKLDALINECDFKIADREKGEYVASLVLSRNMYPLGIEALKYLGPKRSQVKFQARIAGKLLYDEEIHDDAFLDYTAMALMRHKKADDDLLIWLRDHHEGGIAEMMEIYEVLEEKELLTSEYAGKVLEQALFTEDIPFSIGNIYEIYMADHDENGLLAKAVINYMCYRYLTGDRKIDAEFLPVIKKNAIAGDDMMFILTYLKILANRDELDETEHDYAVMMMKRLSEGGIVMPYFKKFIGKCTVPAEIINKTYVSFFAEPTDTVTIHYRTFIEDGTDTPYTTESIKSVFKGIFVKEFLLFADESVQYYITTSSAGNSEERVMKSEALRTMNEAENSGEDGGSLFTDLNECFIAKYLGDELSFKEFLKRYTLNELIIDDIFKLDNQTDDVR